MTERIYERDVTCRQFEATVRSCEPRKKKGYEVILDRTAFYPEGGGQPGDAGPSLRCMGRAPAAALNLETRRFGLVSIIIRR